LFGFGFETLIGKFVNKAVGEVAGAQTDPLAASVMRWIGNLQEHVMRRWYPVTRAGIRCALRPKDPTTGGFRQCTHVAIGACRFCKEPTCLHHAMVNEVAEIACYRCLAEVEVLLRAKHPDWQHRPDVGVGAAPSSGPGPTPEALHEFEQRRKYLKVLGLKDPTSWQEIHRTFRELTVKYHPDRAPQGKRAQHEKKFKLMSEAYSWFNEKPERAVAA
jgi:hypothetical protein